MGVYLCEGKITRYVTVYVQADSAEEAWGKISEADLEYEQEGEIHAVVMDRESVRKAKSDEMPRSYRAHQE